MKYWKLILVLWWCVFSHGLCLCTWSLTQQEQALAQSQGGWLSPGGGASDAKAVDIIQMLTKARTEYDKVGKHQRIGTVWWTNGGLCPSSPLSLL